MPVNAGVFVGTCCVAAVFPGRYDMGTLKKRVYLYLKGRQRACSSSGVAQGRGRR